MNYLLLAEGVKKKNLKDFNSALFEDQTCDRFTIHLYVVHDYMALSKLDKLARMDYSRREMKKKKKRA